MKILPSEHTSDFNAYGRCFATTVVFPVLAVVEDKISVVPVEFVDFSVAIDVDIVDKVVFAFAVEVTKVELSFNTDGLSEVVLDVVVVTMVDVVAVAVDVVAAVDPLSQTSKASSLFCCCCNKPVMLASWPTRPPSQAPVRFSAAIS